MGKTAAAEDSVLRRLRTGQTPVSALVEGLRGEGYDVDTAVKTVIRLQSFKKVTLTEAKPHESMASYALSPISLWFWGAAGAVLLSVALTSVTSGVALYLRYVFGTALIVFLPGYALIEALYPKHGPQPQVERVGLIKAELDDLTRFALSIGLSLAIAPLTGLALNYTPFGIRLLPVVLSLAGLTLALLCVALKKKHGYYKLAKGIA